MVNKLINTESTRNTLGWIGANFFSALLGCFVTLAFSDSVLITVGIIIALIFTLIISYITLKFDNEFNLLKILKKNQKNKNWKEIIRIAYPLSKPLWLSRHYRLRIRLSEYVNEACACLSSSEDTIMINETHMSVKAIQSSVLISDLGWNLFLLNNNYCDKAIGNIKLGISKAEDIGDFDLLIKGYRNLLGIEVVGKHDDKEIKSIHKKIDALVKDENYLKLDEAKRCHIEAGLRYIYVKNSLQTISKVDEVRKRTNLLLDARKKIDEVALFYKNCDPERYAKTFYVKAEICILHNTMDSLNEATDILKEGLEFCSIHQERDKYYRSALLLAKAELMKLKLRPYNKQEILQLKQEIKRLQQEVLCVFKDYEECGKINKEFKELYNQIR